MDEQVLAERLITYDTSRPEGLRAAGAFIKGWLEARDIDVDDREYDGLPVVLADVGPRDGPTVIFHGHVDVVPARAGQFSPRVEGDRLIGRGAYDMKGALAALMCAMRDAAEQDAVRVRFICVPDEESEDVSRRIETLPFSRESSDLFDRPSINLARILGGDAFNKVPDACTMDVDIRFLPNQDPGEILAQIRAIPDVEVLKCFTRAPAVVSRRNPYVRALRDGIGRSIEGEAMSVGRDGASDVISFLQAGVPAVEFGPIGGGHHGPHEWVSISSLAHYRRALGDFVRQLPLWLERQDQPLQALDGGLA